MMAQALGGQALGGHRTRQRAGAEEHNGRAHKSTPSLPTEAIVVARKHHAHTASTQHHEETHTYLVFGIWLARWPS
jgi:hypothetical protein